MKAPDAPDAPDALTVAAALAAIADALPGALFRYRLRPDGTDTVLYISRGCVDLWEVEASDIERDAGVVWAQVHPDDRPAMVESIAQSARDLTPWYWQYRTTTPSGRKKWLQAYGRPEREPDGSVVWHTFILDVTDKRRAEDQRAELERALRETRRFEALGRLAGGIAHDFNNLLTVIAGVSELAVDATDDPELLVGLLAESRVASERASRLARRLLDFARNQARPEGRVDVADHVREVRPILARLLGPGGRLVVEPGEGPAPVHLSPGALDQILLNLVSNARDATGGEGALTVAVQATADEVQLVLEDDGPGLPEEQLEELFEPFFTTRAERGGTGLGLATVRTLVERAGGRIEATNRAPGGARFQLTWPRATVHETLAPSPRDRASPAGAPRRTLLVDPNATIGHITVRMAARHGYEVVAVTDLPRALDALQRGRFDVALIDDALPGVSPSGAADRLRRVQPDLAVVRVGAGLLADEARSSGHLAKPYTTEALLAAIDAA